MKTPRTCEICGVDISDRKLCAKICASVKCKNARNARYKSRIVKPKKKDHPKIWVDRFCRYCGGLIPHSKWYSRRVCCDALKCRKQHEAFTLQQMRDASRKWHQRNKDYVSGICHDRYFEERRNRVLQPLNGKRCCDCGRRLRGPWHRRCETCHTAFVNSCPSRLDDGYIYGGGTSPHAMESMGSI